MGLILGCMVSGASPEHNTTLRIGHTKRSLQIILIMTCHQFNEHVRYIYTKAPVCLGIPVLVLTWHKWCISDHQTSSKMTNSIFIYYVHTYWKLPCGPIDNTSQAPLTFPKQLQEYRTHTPSLIKTPPTQYPI